MISEELTEMYYMASGDLEYWDHVHIFNGAFMLFLELDSVKQLLAL